LVIALLLIPIFLQVFNDANWPPLLLAIFPWLPTTAITSLFHIAMMGPVPLGKLGTSVLALALALVVVYGLVFWMVRQQQWR